MDSNVPKQLCQMDNHLGNYWLIIINHCNCHLSGCVNVVRWSCQGHFLASGSDDKLVMIWKLMTGEGSSTVFGGGGKVNIETWKCVYTLNSHSGDVLDLAWAPHDGWLASGSVDNTVIIWNAHKFPEKISVLKGHTAMVKVRHSYMSYVNSSINNNVDSLGCYLGSCRKIYCKPIR